MSNQNANKEIAIKLSGVKKQYKLGQIGGGTLTAYLQSWWARIRGKEDPNTRYVIIRFDDVTDLHVFDWRDTEEYLPYTENSFIKVDGYGAMSGINFLSFNDGMIEFEECARFRAKDVTLLAFSHNELDFSKYC